MMRRRHRATPRTTSSKVAAVTAAVLTASTIGVITSVQAAPGGHNHGGGDCSPSSSKHGTGNLISPCSANTDSYVPDIAGASAEDLALAQRLYERVLAWCADSPFEKDLRAKGYGNGGPNHLYRGVSKHPKEGENGKVNNGELNIPNAARYADNGRILGAMYVFGKDSGIPFLGSIPRAHEHPGQPNEMLHVWCSWPDGAQTTLKEAFTNKSTDARSRGSRSTDHGTHSEMPVPSDPNDESIFPDPFIPAPENSGTDSMSEGKKHGKNGHRNDQASPGTSNLDSIDMMPGIPSENFSKTVTETPSVLPIPQSAAGISQQLGSTIPTPPALRNMPDQFPLTPKLPVLPAPAIDGTTADGEELLGALEDADDNQVLGSQAGALTWPGQSLSAPNVSSFPLGMNGLGSTAINNLPVGGAMPMSGLNLSWLWTWIQQLLAMVLGGSPVQPSGFQIPVS